MKRGHLIVLALLVAAMMPRPLIAAQEQAETVALRFAVLAPRGSIWHRVLSAWGNTLRAQTQGRLTLHIEVATPGDEPELAARLQRGELDGGCFTAVGLGAIARPSLVLQAPGVFDGYEALDRARAGMDVELRGLFDEGGATLVGWSDFGRARIFATYPIARPADFRGHRAWVLPGDPVAPAFFGVVGAAPVPLPLSEVRSALEARRVDTVIASASAASALQWQTLITHVTRQSDAILVGGILFAKPRVDALPPDLQQALRDTGRQAAETLNRAVRRADDRYFETLTASNGITLVDASAHTEEWRRAAQQARERLVGTVYSRELLARALAAGQGPAQRAAGLTQ